MQIRDIERRLAARLTASRYEILCAALGRNRFQWLGVEALDEAWGRLLAHVEIWCRRAAEQLAAKGQTGEADLERVERRLRQSVEQLVLVLELGDASNPTVEIRLWEGLQKDVEFLVRKFEESARARGFEADDLRQHAWLHFYNKIRQFDPEQPARVTVATWFKQILERKFTELVRVPQKDRYLRGVGGEVGAAETTAHACHATRQHETACSRQTSTELAAEVERACIELCATNAAAPEQVLAFWWHLLDEWQYDRIVAELQTLGLTRGRTSVFNDVQQVTQQVRRQLQRTAC